MNIILKRGLLGLAFATVFAVSYGLSLQAAPYGGTIFGRTTWRGYFEDKLDDQGGKVLPSNFQGGTESIPDSVDSADEFYDFIVNYNLHGYCTPYGCGTDTQRQRGAAFIINTMLGHGAPGNYWPTDQDKALLLDMVRTAAAHGRVQWRVQYASNINSYYQGFPDGSNPADDAFYGQSHNLPTMLFYNQNNQLWFALKWNCGNPVMNTGSPLAPPTLPWNAAGRTSVSDGVPNNGDTPTSISTRPGDVLRWTHNIYNGGPGVSSHWWRIYGQNSSQPWTATYYNNTTLSGAPVLTRQENDIFFNTAGSPVAGVAADNFSARWTKTENLPAGAYQFSVTSDDGVRVLVDGNYVINDWTAHGATAFSGTVNLGAGNHTITIEYFELGGDAYINTLPYMYLTQDWQWVDGIAWYEDRMVNNAETYVVPAGTPAGTKICRNIAWFWKNTWLAGDPWAPPTNRETGVGQMACATVVSDFNLNPTVTAPAQSYVQGGDTVTFGYRIANTAAASPSATCTVRDGNNNVVSVPGSTCAGGQVFNANSTVDVATENVSVPLNATPGTRICRTLTIAPASSSVASRTSPQVCVTVAKTPYVHFTGGDVWAGGGFAAVAPGTCNNGAKITTVTRSGSLSDGTTPGSGVAYAAFALNRITNFGSASMALITSTGVGDNWTFSNINSGNLGFFGAAQRCIPDYVDTYQGSPALAPGTIDVGCLNASCGGGGSGAWRITGNATLRGTLGAGLRKVYLVNGNVTIDNNILYPASYASAAQIPSLVVIATGNIYVNAGVQQMDGVFISRGTFYTCFPKVEPATIATCNTPLTVNGSVSSLGLDLFRTAGADGVTPATQKAPAEIFNLSPEVYLTNALNQTTQTVITTTNLRELPPRF